MTTTAARQRPEYLRMLAGILALYTLIILFAESTAGNPTRIAVLGFLLWLSTRLRADTRLRWAAIALGIGAIAVVAVLSATASSTVVYGAVGACSFVLIAAAIGAIVSTLVERRRVDSATVLGVLCVFLLLALLFASLHQLFASFIGDYLHGASSPPTPSDLLYFSVITVTTVGYGDITPASTVARAIAVTEALTGQLYLVSVVAAVVGGWRRAGK